MYGRVKRSQLSKHSLMIQRVNRRSSWDEKYIAITRRRTFALRFSPLYLHLFSLIFFSHVIIISTTRSPKSTQKQQSKIDVTLLVVRAILTSQHSFVTFRQSRRWSPPVKKILSQECQNISSYNSHERTSPLLPLHRQPPSRKKITKKNKGGKKLFSNAGSPYKENISVFSVFVFSSFSAKRRGREKT